MKLDRTLQYKRIDGVLTGVNENGSVEITITFHHSKFPNMEQMKPQGLTYMEKYMTMWKDQGYYTVEYPQQQEVEVEETILEEVRAAVKEATVGQEDKTIESSAFDQLSRLEQVRYVFEEENLTSPSAIAKRIGANPSYVQRLLKQVKEESVVQEAKEELTPLQEECKKLTELEGEILTTLIGGLYAEQHFSDVTVEDIADSISKTTKTVRGGISSLIKKGYITVQEIGDSPIVYLQQEYFFLHPEWSKE